MKDYEELCRALEKEVRRTLSAPSDFKWLSEQIRERTHENVSASTLMRLWGYMEGVKPRKVTLDILARFLGFMGYDDFMVHQPKEEGTEIAKDEIDDTKAEGANETAIEPQAVKKDVAISSKPRRRIWAAGIAAVLVISLVMGMIFYFNHDKESQEPVYITSIEQLSNKKQYYIHTFNKLRGTLGVYQRQLATTFPRAQQHRCDSASTFALIQYEDLYYLYSVADRRFINFAIHETDAPISGEMCALVIHEINNCLVIDFKNTSTPCTLNANEGNGIIVTDYGTKNGMYDEGNLLQLEEAGDFDPAEALAMLKEPNEEFVAATKSITPEGNYAIYTCFNGSGKEGTTRYYLTASGHLTETLTDSCIFTFHRIEGDSLYRSPAWLIAYHAMSAEDATSKRICFSNRIDLDCKQAGPIGFLRSEPFFRNDWQGKVLYLNRQGNYAIRATAMPIEWWAAGSYWAVYDLDGDGRPESDYSEQRTYVWRLDPQIAR